MMEMVEMEMMEGAPQRGLHCRSVEDMENQRDPGEEKGSASEEVASPEGGDGVSRRGEVSIQGDDASRGGDGVSVQGEVSPCK